MKKGKDVLTGIKGQIILFEEAKRSAEKEITKVNKLRDGILKMIEKFPAKEKPLYQEKIDKIIKTLG